MTQNGTFQVAFNPQKFHEVNKTNTMNATNFKVLKVRTNTHCLHYSMKLCHRKLKSYLL